MNSQNPKRDDSLVVVPASHLHEIVQRSVQQALGKSLPKILRRASLPAYLTTSELSRLANWSPGKIQYLRDQKKIEYVQQGRSVVYPTEWILEYLEKHKITPREDVLQELSSETESGEI